MRTGLLLVATIGLSPSSALAQARTPTPASLIEGALQAMGGEAAVRGLRNKAVDFNSASFALGQEETPLSPPRATISYGRIVTDYAGQRQLITQELRLVSGAVNRQRRVVTSTMGLTDNNGTLNMDQPGAVAAIQRGMTLQPERVLLSAKDNTGSLTALRPGSFRGEQLDGVRYAVGADTMNLWFDRPTGRLVVSEILTDDPVMGDRRTLTWYTRWQDAGESGCRARSTPRSTAGFSRTTWPAASPSTRRSMKPPLRFPTRWLRGHRADPPLHPRSPLIWCSWDRACGGPRADRTTRW